MIGVILHVSPLLIKNLQKGRTEKKPLGFNVHALLSFLVGRGDQILSHICSSKEVKSKLVTLKVAIRSFTVPIGDKTSRNFQARYF